MFLLDNNIQNVDTFHRHNLTAQCTRQSIRAGTAHNFYLLVQNLEIAELTSTG